MRLLLDECVPKRLARELRGHDAKTVQDLGWAAIKNGALLRLANGQFDALLTVDQGIEHQQNLSGLTISVVVMMAQATTLTTSAHYWRLLRRHFRGCCLVKSSEWVANLQMEPTRLMDRAILSPRRAAQPERCRWWPTKGRFKSLR